MSKKPSSLEREDKALPPGPHTPLKKTDGFFFFVESMSTTKVWRKKNEENVVRMPRLEFTSQLSSYSLGWMHSVPFLDGSRIHSRKKQKARYMSSWER